MNSMIDAAASASLLPVVVSGTSSVAPVLTVLLVGVWMIVSALVAPYVTTRVLMTGANPASAFAQGAGGTVQAALSGGAGAATVALTGGAAAAGVITAAAAGAMASGVESAARGGRSARTTSTTIAGLSGLYGASYTARQMRAMDDVARAQKRRATAAEEFTAEVRKRASNGWEHQPHHPNPTQAAIDIVAREKS